GIGSAGMRACTTTWFQIIALIMAFAPVCAHPGEDGQFSVLPAEVGASPAEIVAGHLDARFQPLSGNSYIPKYDEFDVWLKIRVPPAPPGELRVLTIARLPLEYLALFHRGDSPETPVWADAFFDPPPSAEFFTTAFAYRLPESSAAGDVYYLHS